MVRSRRVIRKTHPERYRPVDEQLWPLAVAACALGTLLITTVLSYLRLDDPRWYANAWAYLLAIPLVIMAALYTLHVTGSRWVRRTMQLAMVLCAIVHIGLFIVAQETDVFRRVWTEVLESNEQPDRIEQVKVPHYTTPRQGQQRMMEELFRPTETQAPEPVIAVTARDMSARPPVDVQAEAPLVPPSQMVPLPDVIRREQDNRSVPRRRDERATLSRRESPMRTNPVQVVTVPQQRRQLPQQSSTPEPDVAAVVKRAQPLDGARQPTIAPAHSPRQADVAPTARQQTSRAPRDEQPQAATFPRLRNRTGVVPRTDVQVAEKPAVARRSEPPAPQPNHIAARKQRSLSVQDPQQVTLPTELRAENSLVRRRTSQQPAPRQTQRAVTPRSVESLQPRLTTRPDLDSHADVATRSPSSDSPAAIQAVKPVDLAAGRSRTQAENVVAEPVPKSDNSVTRVMSADVARAMVEPRQPQNQAVVSTMPSERASRTPAVAPVPHQASPVALEAMAITPRMPAPRALAATRSEKSSNAAGNMAIERPAPSVSVQGAAAAHQWADQRTTRRADPVRPSLAELARRDQMPRRSVRNQPQSVSPAVAENPAPRASASAARSAVSPSPMALSQGEVGVAGRGMSSNLDKVQPANESVAMQSSGSARRVEARQDLKNGPALAPQAPALARAGRSDQLRPKAVLKATPLVPATRQGSRTPDQLQASASAALAQAAADAKRDELTASKGTLEIDLGPTIRVAESGSGRAAGGGQPQRSPGTERPAMPRAAIDTTPAATLLADAVQPQAASPDATGGGRPSEVEIKRVTDALVDTRQGDPEPILGGPAALAGGELAATTRTLTATARPAAIADDGPQVAQLSPLLPRDGREALRDRQLVGNLSVADITAGKIEVSEDSQLPGTRLPDATMIAARSDAATTDAGIVSDRKGSGATAADAVNSTSGRLAARAEAVSAPVGDPETGGGTQALPRAARGPQLALNAQADLPQLAGQASSSGRREAEPQSTQGSLITRLATGVDSLRNAAPIGALDEQAVLDSTVNVSLANVPAQQARSDANTAAPELSPSAMSLAKRTPDASRVLTSAEVALEGMVTEAVSPAEVSSTNRQGLVAAQVRSGRQPAGGAMPVDIDAALGMGGLGYEMSVEVGIRDHRAAELSEQVQLNAARFARQQVGGKPTLNTAAAVAVEPFRRRERREQAMGDAAAGVGPETEAAIELGLAYFSQIQAEDGRWTLAAAAQQDGAPQLSSDTAATGLALLAFQGAGYNHREYRYANTVNRGIEFLVKCQSANGDLYLPMDDPSNQVVALYSHSIAALALCEAYGMTQDPELREPAQRSLDFIVQSQHESRGGWRYTPGVGSDTSVTGWMMMALKSGELAQLEVPKDTYQRIRNWLDRAQLSESRPYLYCYNPYAADSLEQRGGRQPTYSMTAVGLLMRLYSGWRRDNPHMARGADHLLQSVPSVGTPSNPYRDTYYWYYATQVMFHMGGHHWHSWNQRLHPLLVGSQIRDGELAGSWDPRSPVPDRWAVFAGRLYVTALNLLSLEVTYRHLPLYEDTAR